jgi:hypothetical protein
MPWQKPSWKKRSGKAKEVIELVKKEQKAKAS